MCLAVPGKIESIDETDPIFRTGKVGFGGIIKTVNLTCVPEARPGDYALVHAGFAIGIIDEEEAQKTLDCLKEINFVDTTETLP
jgi:hydrogenase expression/formation protein HypC